MADLLDRIAARIPQAKAFVTGCIVALLATWIV